MSTQVSGMDKFRTVYLVSIIENRIDRIRVFYIHIISTITYIMLLYDKYYKK